MTDSKRLKTLFQEAAWLVTAGVICGACGAVTGAVSRATMRGSALLGAIEGAAAGASGAISAFVIESKILQRRVKRNADITGLGLIPGAIVSSGLGTVVFGTIGGLVASGMLPPDTGAVIVGGAGGAGASSGMTMAIVRGINNLSL